MIYKPDIKTQTKAEKAFGSACFMISALIIAILSQDSHVRFQPDQQSNPEENFHPHIVQIEMVITKNH